MIDVQQLEKKSIEWKKNKNYCEKHWEAIGRAGYESKHNFAYVLDNQIILMLTVYPRKQCLNKIRLYTEKFENGDLKFKMNGMQPPDHGWPLDYQLFEWAVFNLKDNVSLSPESARLKLASLGYEMKAGPAWKLTYDRFLERNLLTEQPIKFNEMCLVNAKCVEGMAVLAKSKERKVKIGNLLNTFNFYNQHFFFRHGWRTIPQVPPSKLWAR
jgi:hypothetical protein